jgi:antitoxin ParD1/3/4
MRKRQRVRGRYVPINTSGRLPFRPSGVRRRSSLPDLSWDLAAALIACMDQERIPSNEVLDMHRFAARVAKVATSGALMPSKHSLNRSLTGELCDFVASQVASGRFRTSSEVVRAALRLLETESPGPVGPRHPGPRTPSLGKPNGSTTRVGSSKS